jgi:hypothetical protein
MPALKTAIIHGVTILHHVSMQQYSRMGLDVEVEQRLQSEPNRKGPALMV